VEEERKAILRKLEDDLNKASKTSEEYDDGYKGTHKIIEQLKDGWLMTMNTGVLCLMVNGLRMNNNRVCFVRFRCGFVV
jgi:hypothetical protein